MTPQEAQAKVTTKTIHELDYSDFEEIVHSVYGNDNYSYVAGEELGNDSAKTYTAVEGEEVDEWDAELIEAYQAGEGFLQYRASSLIQDLANKGYLPFGDYVIEVCW